MNLKAGDIVKFIGCAGYESCKGKNCILLVLSIEENRFVGLNIDVCSTHEGLVDIGSSGQEFANTVERLFECSK